MQNKGFTFWLPGIKLIASRKKMEPSSKTWGPSLKRCFEIKNEVYRIFYDGKAVFFEWYLDFHQIWVNFGLV